MADAAGEVEDFVVDLVVEVGSRGTDVDDICAAIRLPGREVLRTSAHGTIWLTALVSAAGEAAAVHRVQQSALAQVPEAQRATASTSVVSCAALGELYARLDPVHDVDELESIPLPDLVEQTLWARTPAPSAGLVIDLRPVAVAHSA